MGRIVTVSSKEQVIELREMVLNECDRTAQVVRSLSQENGLALIRRMKFELLGHHPLSGERLNLVEQINQTFTILASLRAAELVIEWHPGRSFKLALGAIGGTDIESSDSTVAAEVFSATHPGSNDKLRKDLARLKILGADFRYVFFACPKYCGGRYEKLEVEGVQVWAVEV